jgi:Ser/Thr protein kinase RdoA (MazF antagonist)
LKVFPVINSTLSPVHLADLLNKQYDFDNSMKCQLIRSGLNDTYLLSNSTDKYVFRIYKHHWRTEKEVLEEIRFLNDLKEQGIKVSFPIVDSKNNFIQRIHAPEGERISVLFSFAKGEKRMQFSEKLHFKAGESMANIHQFSEGRSLNRTTYLPKVLLNDSLESLKGFLSSNTVEMDFMKATQERLLNLFAKINEKELRRGIVHLDIWPDNMNVTENDEITIFDFDFCGNGWLCLDLAYYLIQLHFIEKDINERSSKIQSFLNGYESILNIPNEEKQIFQMLGVSLYFFYLGVQCRRFENWSNVFLSETYLKRYINSIIKPYLNTKYEY